MPHFFALVIVLVFVFPLPAAGKICLKIKPAKRARTKSLEPKAAAHLEKARTLLGAGKRKKAIKRLRKIICRYPKTTAALEVLVIHGFKEGVVPVGRLAARSSPT